MFYAVVLYVGIVRAHQATNLEMFIRLVRQGKELETSSLWYPLGPRTIELKVWLEFYLQSLRFLWIPGLLVLEPFHARYGIMVVLYFFQWNRQLIISIIADFIMQ